MEIFEIPLLLFAVYLSLVIASVAAKRRQRRKRPAPKEEQEDPCDTCLRWPECNGADRDTCPNCETVLHLVPCPKCGGNPVPVRVGDNKQFFAMRCEKCGHFAAKHWEAGLTDEQAAEIWNRRAARE